MRRNLLPTLIRLTASLTIFFGGLAFYTQAYGAAKGSYAVENYRYYQQYPSRYQYHGYKFTKGAQYGQSYSRIYESRYGNAAYSDYDRAYASRYQKLYDGDYSGRQGVYDTAYTYLRYRGESQYESYTYGREGDFSVA